MSNIKKIIKSARDLGLDVISGDEYVSKSVPRLALFLFKTPSGNSYYTIMQAGDPEEKTETTAINIDKETADAIARKILNKGETNVVE